MSGWTRSQVSPVCAGRNPVSLCSRTAYGRLTARVERPTRIILADDHPVVRIGVRNMLTTQEGFDVVGEADDGDEAITQTLDLQPDILLLRSEERRVGEE